MLRKIVAALFFSAALIFAFIFFLLNGIKIKSFSLGQIYISQLYIKLDKKLIVNIEEIKLLNDSKVQNSYEDLQTTVRRIPTFLEFFERIDIESLIIDGNHFKILLDNNHIYLDNKFLNLSTQYNQVKNSIVLDLYGLYLKDVDLLLQGSVNLDYDNLKAAFYGNYTLQKRVQGELNTQFTQEYIDFFATTKQVKDIKFLRKLFRLDEVAEEWMYDNVTGNMQLNFLQGKLRTQTLEPVMESIKGEAVIKNANITFNTKVAPVKTKQLTISYENDTLSFDLYKPTYKGLSIDGSWVKIPNLTEEKTGRVDVYIQTKELLTDDILAITNAYDINIPVKQVSGQTNANVLLKIPYVGELEAYGNFTLKNSKLLINNSYPFSSRSANIELKQDKVIIKGSHFKIEDLLDSRVDLTIDTSTLKAQGNALINDFYVKNNKKDIVKITKLNTPIFLDFNNDTLIDIQKIQTNIVLKEEFTQVNIDNLQDIYGYSNLLQENKLEFGNAKIFIVDENNITFEGFVDKLKLPLKRNGKAVESIYFDGAIKEGNVTVTSKDADIKLEQKKNEALNITLNNFDIYPSKETTNSINEEMYVHIFNSYIYLKDKKYHPKNLKVHIKKDQTTFSGVVNELDIPISYKGKQLTQLSLKGNITDDIFEVVSSDKRLKLKILKDKEYFITLNNLDLIYNTDDDVTSGLNVQIDGKDSNILINEKFKVISNKYDFKLTELKSEFILFHNKTKMSYLKDEKGLISIKASKVSDTFINTFFQKEFVEGGLLDVEATGKDHIVSGRITFKENNIKNLKTLNNVILLVNTSPGIVNPFLAIPSIFGMVTSGGFNVNGYLINKGYVDFTYNFDDKFLNMYTVNTVGNSVDFDGFATFDFKKDIVHSDMKLIFMKGYSSAINVIPGLDYILLGDDKQISTLVNIRGKIEEPDIKTNVLKDGASAPVDVLKRIFTLPLQPFLD